jgi:hypothetical protein
VAEGPGIPLQGKRLVPDVALVADSDTGALIVLDGADVGGDELERARVGRVLGPDQREPGESPQAPCRS